jgi:hypothetical protein
VLYVSPLKALAVDVERNLRAPLAGIRQAPIRLGRPEPAITVGMRTGDTPFAWALVCALFQCVSGMNAAVFAPRFDEGLTLDMNTPQDR